MTTWIVWAVALMSSDGELTSVDLDGDGKKEKVTHKDGTVTIGKYTVPCDEGSCTVEQHDISAADKTKEVAVCAHGPRDDRYCALYTLADGQLQQLKFAKDLRPPQIITAGNDVVLTRDWDTRLYNRVVKYKRQSNTLVEVKQPLYAADGDKAQKIKLERSITIVLAPASKEAVGTSKPDSDVVLLGESPEQRGWYLVKLSSGICGWVQHDAFVAASQELTGRMGAG